VLERLQLPGRPGTGIQPGLVPDGADPDLFDVLLQPGDVAVEVVDRDLGPDPLVVERGDLPCQAVHFGVFRQGTAAVRQLGQAGVDGLEIE
jgi:hypothetical protein